MVNANLELSYLPVSAEFVASLQKMCVHSLYRRQQFKVKLAAFLACWAQRIAKQMGKQNRLAQKIIGKLVQLSPPMEGRAHLKVP